LINLLTTKSQSLLTINLPLQSAQGVFITIIQGVAIGLN